MSRGRLSRLRQDLRTVLLAAAVAAVVAATPALAAVVADFAKNSHKVDGKHAVSASASISKRANKLVATNKAGRLPNNIITKAPNADKLDGLDGTALMSKAIAGWKDGPVPVPAVIYASMAKMNLPAGKYVIHAKAWIGNSSSFTETVTCRLLAGADFDETQARVQDSSGTNTIPASLMVVHEYASPGVVDLQCKDVTGGQTMNFIKITALKMDSLTNTMLP